MSAYTPITSQTLSSAAASVTFSSIAQGYTDLVLAASAYLATGSAEDLYINFNGDTSAIYSITTLNGQGSVANSQRSTNTSVPSIGGSYGAITTGWGNWIINIQNYSNATTYKTFISRGNNAGFGVAATVGLWRSTSAITSILIAPTGSKTIASGSTFTLYGIKAA
jgi:hypothetical protein